MTAFGEPMLTDYSVRLTNSPSAQDFDVANLAREQIENVVNKFNQEAKKSAWEHLGFMHKTSKQKAVEVLQDHTNKDFNDLKALVDNLEGEWKEAHGPVCVVTG